MYLYIMDVDISVLDIMSRRHFALHSLAVDIKSRITQNLLTKLSIMLIFFEGCRW